MTVQVKHNFTSAKADSTDATLINPSNWNDVHSVHLTGPALLGSSATGDGAAAEIAVAGGLTLASGALSVTTPYTSFEQTKLATITPGATVNATDAQLRDRATHTGTQAIATVTGLQTALDAKPTTFAALTDNITADIVGTNTGVAAAISAKQATLVSGTNIKTVNGTTLLGAGDLPIVGVTTFAGLTDKVTADLVGTNTGLAAALAAKPTAYAGLTDAATANLPANNTPLATALAGKAPAVTALPLGADTVMAATDDGKLYYATVPLLVTFPAGLTPRPNVGFIAPPTGNLSVAVSGGATLNKGTATLTFNRDTNPAGVMVTPYAESDGYGAGAGAQGIPLNYQSALQKNTLAVLGTSIEALTSDVIAGGAPSYYRADGALSVANSYMGCPWSSIANYGLSGDTSGPSVTGQTNPGMLSRVAAIITGGYGWCYVGFPINDVTNGINPVATTIPNMLSIYSQLLAAGITVIAGTGGPTSTLNSAGLGAYRDAYAKVQTAIRNYVVAHSGIVLANTALAMTDPATGLPFTSPATTIDGTHDNYEGAGRKAQCIIEVVQPLLKAQDTVIENIHNPRNYAVNPYSQGDNATGVNGALLTTVTGTVPNAWSARVNGTGTAVGSRAPQRASTWRQPGQAARLAITAAANWDGAFVYVGGDDLGAKGRYDQTWTASQALTYGDRKKPVTPNGYHYFVITPGTTAATEPTWTTVEGNFITDGSVVYMCRKSPATGDSFFAECDVDTSGLTAGKGANVRLQLQCLDTASASMGLATANFVDLSGSAGLPSRYLPPKMKLRTPPFTIAGGNGVIRYLRASVYGVAEAGASFNMDIFRVAIIRVT